MEAKVYLILEKRRRGRWCGRGDTRVVRTSPDAPQNLHSGQIAIRVIVKLPDNAFEPQLVVVNVDAGCIQRPAIEVAAQKP